MTNESKVIEALRVFKNEYNNADVQDRYKGFHELLHEINKIYDVNVRMSWDKGATEESYKDGVIYMAGKLSVISLLKMFAIAIGKSVDDAIVWSLALSRSVFPYAYDEMCENGTAFNSPCHVHIQFRDGTLDALKEFKSGFPYRVGNEQRFGGMTDLLHKLNSIYGTRASLTWVEDDNMESSLKSYYSPLERTIYMVGKLSIITFLHEFAHVLGMNEHDARIWSIELFRQVYPRAYRRLRFHGHVLTQEAING